MDAGRQLASEVTAPGAMPRAVPWLDCLAHRGHRTVGQPFRVTDAACMDTARYGDTVG